MEEEEKEGGGFAVKKKGGCTQWNGGGRRRGVGSVGWLVVAWRVDEGAGERQRMKEDIWGGGRKGEGG